MKQNKIKNLVKVFGAILVLLMVLIAPQNKTAIDWVIYASLISWICLSMSLFVILLYKVENNKLKHQLEQSS